jgi:hypothetical protein
VGAHEALLEVLGALLGDPVQGYARGVGRDDGLVLRRLLDAPHEFLFGFDLLDDGFDDPIRLGHALEVVLEVAYPDPIRHVVCHERGRPGVLHPFEAGLYDGVVVVVIGGNV